MAKRKLKNWIKTYLKYTENSESPDKFHWWVAVSTIAGALRRRVYIDQGHFSWLPNFFIFFVAPPGIVQKSTTGSVGIELLKELDYIKLGPASSTWQALIKYMAEECQEEIPLPNGDFIPMTSVTISVSELGTFLDPRNREEINILVDLWDGKQGAWLKLAKHDGGDVIVNPWINIIGFTTPSWIADNFSEYFIGGGFASRSIFVYAEKKKKLIAYPKEFITQDFYDMREDLIHDLFQISDMLGEYILTPDAITWGKKWYKEHNTSDHSHISSDKFSGYLSRKQTHTHKLAMILAAAESDNLIITEKNLREATEQITKIEQDMPIIFSQMNREGEMRLAADVLHYLRQKRKALKVETYRDFFKIMTYDTFEKVIRSLIQSGLVNQVQPQGESVVYLIPTNQKENN